MPDVDVLVVGGGPAGSVAAAEAKRAAPELSVVLLERDRAIGAPVRCAEGVGDAGLREFADPTGASWTARKITKVIFWAPDGTEVKVAERDVGWVLDRTRFDAHLAAQAVSEGAEVRVGTEVTGMRREGERWVVDTRGPRGRKRSGPASSSAPMASRPWSAAGPGSIPAFRRVTWSRARSTWSRASISTPTLSTCSSGIRSHPADTPGCFRRVSAWPTSASDRRPEGRWPVGAW